MKAPRNKTIDMSIEEGREYLERCLSLTAPAEQSQVLDRTILGDCMGTMPLLPRGFVDLAVIDPPYNLYKDFGGSKFSRMDKDAYEKYTERWLLALLPLMKKTGSIYVCCDWQCSDTIARVLEKHLHIRNRITWQREKGRGSERNWKNCTEDIWFATVSNDYTFNADAVKQRRRVIAPYRQDGAPKDWEETAEGKFRNSHASNFWDDISIPYWSMPENTAHPTQKPEKLLAKLILASSNEGDVVFDPFLGSGSTAVTAKKLGRHYVGIEQNALYCVWCEKRLEMAEDDRDIQGYSGGVFWERNTAALQKKYKPHGARKIYLVRHGQPDFPGGETYCIGRADFPLDAEGRRQAEKLAIALKDKKLTVFSSPLKRAYDTALCLSPQPIIIEGLQEMHAGDWDGLSFSEIRRRWPELYEARAEKAEAPIPNAEDWEEGQLRFIKAVEEALAQSEGDIAIVAHTTVILSFVCHIMGSTEYKKYKYRPGYGGYYLVTAKEDGGYECSFPWRSGEE